jgi:hypothetical protein
LFDANLLGLEAVAEHIEKEAVAGAGFKGLKSPQENSPMRKLYLALWLASLAGGCASPWEKYYKPFPAAASRHPTPVSSATIRRLSFQRFTTYSEALAKLDADSAVAQQDLPEAEKLRRRQLVQEALQLPTNDAGAFLVGASYLWATGDSLPDPEDGQLERFSKKIGADIAIVVISDGGLSQRVAMIPTFGSAVASDGYNTAVASGTSQTPVTITERRTDYLVLYVRTSAAR